MSGLRKIVIGLSLIVSLALPVYFAAAALGVKYDMWDWRTGLLTLTIGIGPILIALALILGVVALLFALARAPRGGATFAALLALAVPAAGLGLLLKAKAAGDGVPPIHDVQTDWSDPVRPSAAVLEARGGADNPIEDAPVVADNPIFPDAGGKAVSALQADAYPDLAPIMTDRSLGEAFAAARACVLAAGLEIVHQEPAEGVIEATATSFWFGFQDDVMVRVRETPAGARIDMRSVSRVGLSDLGVNAARLRTLTTEIERELAG